MRRRDLIALAAGATVLRPLAGRTQTAKVAKIGYVGAGSIASAGHHARAFEQGLRDLGYVPGQNIVIEYRWADGKLERLPGFVTDLIGLGIDAMISSATPALWAAKERTGTIPLIMAGVTDAVGSGLVASLARPGGNITGLTHRGACPRSRCCQAVALESPARPLARAARSRGHQHLGAPPGADDASRTAGQALGAAGASRRGHRGRHGRGRGRRKQIVGGWVA
jgi:putative tryptophan/tyrosine transport system substrate-binding protein